jgi:hypothetical protein
MQLSIEIPDDMADAVRAFLAENADEEGELSAFVLEAVRDRIFAETVKRVKARNAQFDQQEIMDTIDEAVTWARENRN